MFINPALTAIENKIKQLFRMPNKDSEKYKKWLSQNDFFSFLKDNLKEDDVILYLSIGDHLNPYNNVYIYGVLVPTIHLDPLPVDDLMDWGCNPTAQWGISMWADAWDEAELCSPFDFSSTRTLKSAMQLIFLRSFEGRTQDKIYFDVSEIVLQPHGLHHVPERSSFCRLDEDGNIDDVIKIMCNYAGDNKNKIVTINKNVLKQQLQITKSCLVRFFESRRLPGESLNATTKQRTYHSSFTYYIRSYFGDNQSMIRGFQIIDNSAIKPNKRSKKKRYEKFIAHDWKNNKIKKVSCDPKKMASYFQSSSLPFETTPVFFRSDVLIKYKNDPEKYLLTDTSIECRNSWCLECYHINEAKQVFTYLVYLSKLPFQEQQYWVSFNEKPNGGISRAALLTDFEGQFDLSYEPLSSLKRRLHDLGSQNLSWWKMKDNKLLNQLHYPITDSIKEWSDLATF